MRRFVSLAIFVVFAVSSVAVGQIRLGTDSQRVSIESVTNSYQDTLIAGKTHEVLIRVMNKGIPQSWKHNYSNGFRIYSPNGAVFGPVGADTLRNPTSGKGYLGGMAFPLIAGYNLFSNDGLGADTILFFGSIQSPNNPGLAANFDQVALSLRFTSRLADSGKTICVDSSFASLCGVWVWAESGSDTSNFNVRPRWGGGRCFTVSGNCCRGFTGNVDCDEQDLDDLVDLTRLVDYLFISFAPLCCPGEADMNLDNVVDIADLTVQVSHMFISFDDLPACSGL